MKAERETEARGQRPAASDVGCAQRSADALRETSSSERPRGLDRPYALRSLTLPARRGFTLVELMVVMAIIAILGSAMAYAIAGAQESAKIAKTRSLIARLHALVMQKYESYRTRRLPIAIPARVIQSPANNTMKYPNGQVINTPTRAIAKVRCDAIRQLMRMEMPDRWTDVVDDPINITVEQPGAPGTDPSTWPVYYDADPSKNPNDGDAATQRPSVPALVTMQRPSSSQAYLSAYRQVFGNTPSGQDPVASARNQQNAKCLYLLIKMGLDDPDVLENFSEQDIGYAPADPSTGALDTQSKVFLDAWGRPIWYLRWAPGLVSSLQPDAPAPGSTASDQRMRDQTDPTGIYGSPQPGTLILQPATASQTSGPGRIGGNTFALYPLIWSAGSDGNYDFASDRSANAPLHYASTNPLNNPFASVTDSQHFQCPVPPTNDIGGGPLGAPFWDQGRSCGIADNITNQDIGAR